jgi:NAD+ kinase
MLLMLAYNRVMAKIGLVIRSSFEKPLKSLANELLKWAEVNSHETVFEKQSAQLMGYKNGVPAAELVEQADPIVTLGGDGTLIGVACHVTDKSPVLLGVNFGNLGFLTEVAPGELFSSLEAVFSGKAKYAVRAMLQTKVYRGQECIFSSAAINDAVIQKESRGRILLMDLMVDNEDVMRVRGDGMIFSTPTGSTAYSLAAGGSIAHPSLPVILMTPICPHSLTTRPLILPDDMELSVRIPQYEGEVFVYLDGQIASDLRVGDRVVITKAESTVRFVKSASQSYFDIIRTKLNWGIENRSGRE